MIPRYEHKEIANVWTDEYKFKTFLEVELALLEVLEEQKTVPKNTASQIRNIAKINPARITEIENQTRHDVIAFCTSITEQVPIEIGKYFHYGVTSSDVIDTGLNLQIKKSLEIILPIYEKLLLTLKNFSIKHKSLMTFGRSHGIYAEPMSFGQKFLGHYCEFKRRHDELVNFYNSDLTLQLSGAVGNYTILSPEIEEKVSKKLNLFVEPVSTQIIPRDRIAKLISITSLIANAIERLAVEIRHLHHSDIAEVSEGFKAGQKGSSTMPHKKNPISGENLTGLSRYLRSHLTLALENAILWHERDISHSSAERLFLPDHFGILAYSLTRLEDTISNLEVNENFIEEKVMKHAHYLSSYYLHELISKVSELKREDLYTIVQKVSFNEVARKNPDSFRSEIEKELKLLSISITLPKMDENEIRRIYLKHVDKVFTRALE